MVGREGVGKWSSFRTRRREVSSAGEYSGKVNRHEYDVSKKMRGKTKRGLIVCLLV